MANVAPPKGFTRAESKELNRRRLLQAARELLIETGYGALSARQVSARAGVAQSSFYAHFKDKEDLVRTLTDEIFGVLRGRLREIRQGEDAADWDNVLSQILLSLHEFFLDERDLIALLFQELGQPGSPISQIGHQIFDTLHQDFQEDLVRLIADKKMPDVPVQALITMIIGTCAYMLQRILAGRIDDPLAMFAQLGVLNRAMMRGMASDRRAQPEQV